MESRLRLVVLIACGALAGCQCVNPSELVVTGCRSQADCPSGQSCCPDSECRASCGGTGGGATGGGGGATGGSGGATGGGGGATGGSGGATGGSGGATGGGTGGGTFDAGVNCNGVACAVNQKCVNDSCVVIPCSEVSCLPSEACSNGGCFPKNCPGANCATGALCLNGACNHASCAFVNCPNGQRCTNGACQPTSCAGGACDGGEVCSGSQCQDTSCAGLSCAAGKVCSHSECVTASSTESSCADGLDNDSDTLTDCADPDCAAKACNDSNQCTVGEACMSGVCQGGTVTACSAPPQCKTLPGTCTAGVCGYVNAGSGVSCDDNNPCTLNDTCSNGSCSPGPLKVCNTPPNDCFQAAGFCQTDGVCAYTPKTAGSVCNDGNGCTLTDTCNGSGTCVGTNVKSCPGPGFCEANGVCQPGTGSCTYAAATGANCDNDGNPCTVGGTCQSNKTCLNAGAQGDGFQWGSAVQRCCGGQPKDISTDVNHCGGCGSACISLMGYGVKCVPVQQNRDGSAMTCAGAAPESGRCDCIGSANCPRSQNCYSSPGNQGTALCEPGQGNAECAPGQVRVAITACAPAGQPNGGPDYCKY